MDTIWQAEQNENTVSLLGEIDYTVSTQVRDYLMRCAALIKGELLLDLTKLTYLDSSGLAVLIELRRVMKERELSVRITDVSPQVEKLLKLTQVSTLFGV